MTKIMLVEDDKSLREIYGVRLLAEGYDIVSAGDGEEALAMAIKERPQLIVSDVMMPKISGFDMLDILRSTTETRDIKVIMMTALSSEEQRQRGEQLGADRYLVKSQVGIEDVVRVVHEVLGDTAGVQQPAATPVDTPAATTQPTSPAPAVAAPNSTSTAPTPPPSPAAPAPASDRPQLAAPRPMQHTTTNPVPPSLKSRIIQPLNDPSAASVDMKELLDKELAKEAGVDMEARPEVTTTDQEKDLLTQQLNQFESQLPAADDSGQNDDIPSVSIASDGSFVGPQLDEEGNAISSGAAASQPQETPTEPTITPDPIPTPAPTADEPIQAPVAPPPPSPFEPQPSLAPPLPVEEPAPQPEPVAQAPAPQAAPAFSAMPTPMSFGAPRPDQPDPQATVPVAAPTPPTPPTEPQIVVPERPEPTEQQAVPTPVQQPPVPPAPPQFPSV